ncbi:MAG TPA: HAMP domain-containing sensor histidine kinase [Dactylosporangium sp.]|nr:HAMP domain-containing sensor histidine kinase [Dactylosporangium sp.]
MTRLTIRGRLTLWYAAVFAATGAAVLAAMYLLVRREFFTATDAVLASVTAAEGTLVPVPGTILEPGTGPAVALEAATTVARTDALRTIVLETGGVFVALAAVSLALCWLVAGRALRPLRSITDTAAALSHDTMDARIGLRGPRDEVRTLADTFDAMLDRLARAFQGQRLFVANASHELRTPLTIIRTAAEKALARPSRTEDEYRRALQTIAAAASRSDAMLTSLLQLARTQRGAALEPVDLADAAAGAAASWPADAPPLHRDLAPAPCAGDPAQLDLLLRNLLENAARHNVPGGAVWLATGGSWLRVENTGPVVDPADLPSLRRPFQRGGGRTAGSPGAGLGLAIAEAVVAAHGAAWTLVPRAGGGLSVTVTFPAG